MKKFILLIIEKIRKALKVDEKGNSFGWRKVMLLLAALIMVGCSFYDGWSAAIWYLKKRN